ncbi:nucleotide-diphospho-sugar transferase [Cokeromyces recurvatus]|uniref:nucleotide-diphospho-sugar transferase n=1 Tax=Cokeromyces recurvatus TaxID=90255 RepID=UPI00221E4BB1|nr:nucleotide-diphospho-sugar transferase [Cokeromyces recurvatus]KAI7898823.1 nucleotide-diphospho-sugar transferase [Cokeromyces recurvatus]
MIIHWTVPLKILYSIIISSFFVLPALIGYALRLEITRRSFWVLGVYGSVVFMFIFLQLLFASLNRLFTYYYARRLPNAVSLSTSRGTKNINEKVAEIECTNGNTISKNTAKPTLSSSEVEGITIEQSPPLSSSMLKSCPETIVSMDQETMNEKASAGRPATSMGLAVVGYREEPTLFKKCLQSIKELQYPDPFKVIVVIDGDAPEDKEMAHVFQTVFPSSPVMVLPELLSVSFQKVRQSSKEEDLNEYYNQLLRTTYTLPTHSMPVCYIQPHRGKRHAMYTAFRVLMAAGCEAIMTTDSDTKFDSQAMIEMERALYWFPNIGAAAGDVRIWNATDGVLSFMSSLRYWMAFNIERAAQSFNRCVTCVSGPMGIYRSYVLQEILDDWISQTFLGMECTYGDDRHLTNRTLLQGYRVVYTHLAFCETETPTDFLRWFKQQTRWSKSFYRELFWNIRSLHKHSPWMAAELFYQGIYPFVLLFSIFQILFSKSPFVLCVWLISLALIATIKTMYSVLITWHLQFLAFPFYSIYYMVGLVPAKLWAIISLWDIGWGTSARSASERKVEMMLWTKFKEALPVMIWLTVLLGGVAFNVVIYLGQGDRMSILDFFSIDDNVADPNSIVFYRNPNNF